MLGQAAMAALGAGAQVGCYCPSAENTNRKQTILGFLLAADAGYDPRESVALWERMGQVSGGGGPSEFLSTHPNHETRIEQLKKWMPEAMAMYQTRAADADLVFAGRSRSIRAFLWWLFESEISQSACSSPASFFILAQREEDWVIARWRCAREESPDFMGRALGNSQAERSDTSTTEIKPPMAKAMGSRSGRWAQVRVKRWGKSPPRWW